MWNISHFTSTTSNGNKIISSYFNTKTSLKL